MRKQAIWYLVLLLCLTFMLAACSSDSETGTQPESPGEASNEGDAETGQEGEVVDITTFQQSPMLDDMDLPPIEERLPKEPKISNEMPADLLEKEIGRYGGTLRFVTTAVDWDADVFVINNEPLVNTPGATGDEVTPNIVRDFEVSEDRKEFTFYLREGLRWSDGEYVTMEDFRFTMEDVLMNEELTPSIPNWLRSGGRSTGEPFKFEVVDDLTFKLSFDEPYGGLPVRMAIQGWRGYTDLLKPAHYLKQFHVNYVDLAELEPLIEEEGFEEGEWYNLFNLKDITNWELSNPLAIGFPVLYPWIFVEKHDTVATFERNPYYFKIDEAGNQLPYIDKLESYFVQDMEMLTVKTLAGEVDYSRESAVMSNMPLYRENEERGGYRAIVGLSHLTINDVVLNLSHEDPVWREVVGDVRFRRALNLAIDREEIIDAIYYGFGEPSQMLDSTFDLDEANRLLDEMGMTIGADGYRVGPDGNRFTIPFEISPMAPDFVPLTELIVEHWKALNLHVTMQTIDNSLRGTRNAANELKASMVWTHTPLWYHDDWGQGQWAPLWWRWHTSGGTEGEEPPEDVKEFYRLIDEVSVQAGSSEEARENIAKLEQMMRENVYYFVHTEQVRQPLVVNAKLANVSETAFTIATNFGGEEYFFRE